MATALPVVGGHKTAFAATHRTDSWWAGPTATFLGLGICFGYLTVAMLLGDHYYYAPYLSPVYAPTLWTVSGVPGAAPLDIAWFGEWPTWIPTFIPATPAILILAFPGTFRGTCYYYRKAYYRAYGMTPPGCAVGPLRAGKPYKGETTVLLVQNLHRYALYAALVFNVLLFYEAYVSFFKDGQFGVGVGSIVMTVNAVLLCSYSFGCHSFRHIIGGRKDAMSCGKETASYKGWKFATWFNERHMQFAWVSLFWVCFTDIYVRIVSMGIIPDLNTWN